MLNLRQIRFVKEYVKDGNGTKAAIRAGYSEDTADAQASYLLNDPRISKAIDEKLADQAYVAELDTNWVVKRWMEIANADANEIVTVKRCNCRHCWGVMFAYQWTETEYMRAVNESATNGREPPDGLGGFGFDVNAEPNPDCPECGGEGVENVRIADTGKLKGPARRLYAGAKHGRHGIEVKMRDQDAALTNLGRYLGLMVDRQEVSGPGGGPLVTANLKAEDLTDDQLAALMANNDDDKQT